MGRVVGAPKTAPRVKAVLLVRGRPRLLQPRTLGSLARIHWLAHRYFKGFEFRSEAARREWPCVNAWFDAMEVHCRPATESWGEGWRG